jgi:hypothetical protein
MVKIFPKEIFSLYFHFSNNAINTVALSRTAFLVLPLKLNNIQHSNKGTFSFENEEG